MPAENLTPDSAKQRALRLPLDYYRQRDPIVRTKWLLGTIGAAVAGVYIIWLFIGGGAGRRHASPGALAAAHARWENDCQSCHLDFRPLRSDAFDWVSLFDWRAGGVSPPRSATRRDTLDQACIACHDKPGHHQSAIPGEVATCAACHRDHHGLEANIVRPDDAMCTRCHAKIDQHRAGASGATQAVANVTGFGLPQPNRQPVHPPFRSLDHDPGNVKFNHWLHLQPGLAVTDAKQKFRLNDIDESQRQPYASYATADGLIQLDCSACHQLRRSEAGLPAAGDYMLPISYEQHCRACHPLQVNLASDSAAAEPANVPHGLPSERLSPVLDGLILAAERSNLPPPPQTPDESGAVPLIPGKTLGNNLAQKLSADALQRRARVAQAIRLKCLQCHFESQSAAADSAGLPDVQPAKIPAVWLAHARFDHSAHRNVDCRVCHVQAYAYEQRDKPRMLNQVAAASSSGATEARDDQEVMIAGIETCVTCHAPASGSTGGARHDCAECHLYHDRDSVLELKRPGGAARSSPGRKAGVGSDQATKQRSGGPAQLLGAASTDPRLPTPNLRLVSLAAPVPTWLGPATCASANCHGDVSPGSAPWRSAVATWLARDPHAQAYNVLWTFRAREMTRLLSWRAGGVSPPVLSDAEHSQILEQRCLACHTTPTDSTPGSDASYALGVHCESCHGPAGNWLHAHDRAGFEQSDARQITGFIDTKDLNARASACMPCHVGASSPTRSASEGIVDHDLIAAGHPRLNFEFHSYVQSLPAHWDHVADQHRHSGVFHYRSWLSGQRQHSEQLAELAQPDTQNAVSDFALLDCFACHHNLGQDNWRQQQLIGERQSILDFRPAHWFPGSSLGTQDPEAPASTAALPDRLQVAAAVFANAARPDQSSWDACLQAYLAARAITADIAPEARAAAAGEIAALETALAKFGRYLARDCFTASNDGNKQPTQYDSPARFTPTEAAGHVQPVLDALIALQAALPAE